MAVLKKRKQGGENSGESRLCSHRSTARRRDNYEYDGFLMNGSADLTMNFGRSRSESISWLLMTIWILYCAGSSEAFSILAFSLPSPQCRSSMTSEADQCVVFAKDYTKGINQSLAASSSIVRLERSPWVPAHENRKFFRRRNTAHQNLTQLRVSRRSHDFSTKYVFFKKFPLQSDGKRIVKFPTWQLFQSFLSQEDALDSSSRDGEIGFKPASSVGTLSPHGDPNIVSLYVNDNFYFDSRQNFGVSTCNRVYTVSNFLVNKNGLKDVEHVRNGVTFSLDGLTRASNGRNPTENGGFLHSDESRAKISAANKGKTPWNKGKNHSDEVRLRISEGVRARNREKLIKKAAEMGLTLEEYEKQKKEEKRLREAERRRIRTENGGYKLDDETRKKISKTLKEKWARGEVKKRDPTTYYRKDSSTGSRQGKKHSDETKDKIRRTLKAKWENDEEYRQKMQTNARKAASKEETRKKISDTLKKKWQDPEFRSKMLTKIKGRKSLVGSRTDDEHRKKISEAMRRKWQDPTYRTAACNGMAKKRSMAPEKITQRQQHSDKKKIVRLVTPTLTPKKGRRRVSSESEKTKANNVKRKPLLRQINSVRPVEPINANHQQASTKSNGALRPDVPKKSAPQAMKPETETPASKLKKRKVQRKDSDDASKIPTRRKTSITEEEERVALMKESNPDLFDLLYGDEAMPEEKDIHRNDVSVSFLDSEDDDDFDLENFDPYGLDELETSSMSQHESMINQ